MAEKRTRTRFPNTTPTDVDQKDDPQAWFERTHAALIERMAGRAAMLGERATQAQEIRKFTAELARRTAALLRAGEGTTMHPFGKLGDYVVGEIHRPESDLPKDQEGKPIKEPFDPLEMKGWFLKRTGNVGGSLPEGFFLTTEGRIFRYSVDQGVYNNKLDKETNTTSSLPFDHEDFTEVRKVRSAVMLVHDDPAEDYLANFRSQTSYRPADTAHAVSHDDDLQQAMETLLQAQGLSLSAPAQN